jgi:isovaleryl-CoA dehydrogenase
MRLLGGRGMGKHETAEKFHRDLLALSILGGTVELQKITLYQELARRRAGEQSSVQGKGADVNITLHEPDMLEPTLERALVNLTARLFPGEAMLAGRYYYDTPPDWVLLAWKDGKLAGFLVIPRRQIELGGSPIRVAGLGIGIEAELQRQGTGTALVRRALELLRELGDDLAVAILLGSNAEKLFHAFGFRKLEAQVTHFHRDSGQLTTETMPVFALDLNLGCLVDDIEALGRLHLGLGTW